MMQPVDIRSTSFGKGLFGYKKTDVDSYVDTVYRAYDEAFNEVTKLREENQRITKLLEEKNLRIIELEKGVSTSAGSSRPAESASPKADFTAADDSKDDAKKSNASKFFDQKSEDTPVYGSDDEVFVGEIEDNRKSNKVMIGDGEEEGADDFEFL